MLLDQLLAAVVGRVRLAGDDQLHRPLGVQQQALEPLRVAQHQRQPLVRRHAPREADRQHVGVERASRSSRARRGPRRASPTSGRSRLRASSTSRSRSSRLVAQISRAGHLVDRRPEALGVVGLGVGALADGQVDDLAGDPGRRVHAVGDRADRHLGLVEGRPQPAEHPAADLAVQLRDAVGALRQPEAHHRHVEDRRRRRPRSPRCRARGSGRPARRGSAPASPKYCSTRVSREPVDARRHRGVGGEHGGRAADLERGVEVELRAVLGHGELADPLDAEEAGVALVGVEHLGRRVPGDPAVARGSPGRRRRRAAAPGAAGARCCRRTAGR